MNIIEIRKKRDKRIINIDKLRLNVILYDEENFNDKSIKRIVKLDIRKDLDFILVIEIYLTILETKRLAKKLY